MRIIFTTYINITVCVCVYELHLGELLHCHYI